MNFVVNFFFWKIEFPSPQWKISRYIYREKVFLEKNGFKILDLEISKIKAIQYNSYTNLKISKIHRYVPNLICRVQVFLEKIRFKILNLEISKNFQKNFKYVWILI